MSKLLKFEEKGKDIYYVYNHEDEFLGVINKSRVGRFVHWVFCPEEKTFFTNGCLKEITEFITKLYKKDKKENEENREISSEEAYDRIKKNLRKLRKDIERL